jgi:hypothetical protein
LETSPPAKATPKRRAPQGKAGAANPQASPEAQDTPQGRRKAGGHRGVAQQRAGSSGKRVATISLALPNAGQTNAPKRFDLPTVDPMADLVGLADRRLQESLQSLRSVADSRTPSELLERQSQHMRLMMEIWMPQAQRSTEVFNAMLNQRRD